MKSDPSADALEAIAAALTELTASRAGDDTAEALQTIAAALTEMATAERKETDLAPVVQAIKALKLETKFEPKITMPQQPVKLTVEAGPQTHNVTVEQTSLEGVRADLTYDEEDRITTIRFVREA